MKEEPIKKISLTVESTIIGLFEFAWRFLVTAYATVFIPDKILHDLKNKNEPIKFVRPFTFLAISCVIGGFSFGSYDFWDFYKGEASLFKFYETKISVSSIYTHILQIFPTLFAVILYSIILSLFIEKETKGIKSVTVKILCFCGGCQILLMNFITVFIYYTAVKAKIQTLQKIGISQGEYIHKIETPLGGPIYILVIIFFMLCAVYTLGTPAIFKSTIDRITEIKRLKKLIIFFCSILISIGLATSIQFAYRVPNFFNWLRDLEKNEYTYIERSKFVSYIGAEVSSGLYFSANNKIIFTVFAINKSNNNLIFRPNALSAEIAIIGRVPYRVHFIHPQKIKITDWENRGEMIRIQPNNVSWLKIKIDVDKNLEDSINMSELKNTFGEKIFEFKCEINMESIVPANSIKLLMRGQILSAQKDKEESDHQIH